MGAASVSEYYFDMTDEDWIGVPPVFPYGSWEDARDWAIDIAAAAVPGDVSERARFAMIGEQVATQKPPNVEHTFWFAPQDGRGMGVAYMTVAEIDGELPTLAELSVHGIESATPPQVHTFPSEPFGQIVQSATTIRLSDLGDAAEGLVAGSIRVVGIGGGRLFVLNAIDEDLETLGLMHEPMRELFDTVVFTETDEEIAEAAKLLGFE